MGRLHTLITSTHNFPFVCETLAHIFYTFTSLTSDLVTEDFTQLVQVRCYFPFTFDHTQQQQWQQPRQRQQHEQRLESTQQHAYVLQQYGRASVSTTPTTTSKWWLE